MQADTETATELVRSWVRLAILEQLQDGPATKYDLRDRLDCSRTTVDRNLDYLQDGGWIRETANGYELTTCGGIVFKQATTYLETVRAASRLQPILRWIPRDALDLDVRHLATAEITVGSDAQPMAMVDKHAERVMQSPNARMVLPVVSPQPLQAQFRNFSLSELSVDVVVPPSIADVFTSDPQFADQIAEMREAGAMTVSVTEESIPFYLGILGETVQIGVDENGQPRGLLESDEQAVKTWAEQRFEEYRRGAVPLAEWDESR